MTMEVSNYLKPQLVKFYEGIKHVSALKLVTNINTSCKKTIFLYLPIKFRVRSLIFKGEEILFKGFFSCNVPLILNQQHLQWKKILLGRTKDWRVFKNVLPFDQWNVDHLEFFDG